MFVKYCYYTVGIIGCYNLRANIRCSGCSPLGEIAVKQHYSRRILNAPPSAYILIISDMKSISEGNIVFNGIYELTMSCKMIYVLPCLHEGNFCFYLLFASKLVKYSIWHLEIHYSKTFRVLVIPLAINIMISMTLVPYVASWKTDYVIQGGWGSRCRWIQLSTSDKCQGIIWVQKINQLRALKSACKPPMDPSTYCPLHDLSTKTCAHTHFPTVHVLCNNPFTDFII